MIVEKTEGSDTDTSDTDTDESDIDDYEEIWIEQELRTECVADTVTLTSFISLFSPPESFELFYICKAFSVNTISDMMVDDYRRIIQKGDKYIGCNYLEKVKEKHGRIYYKSLSKTVYVLPAQVLCPLVSLDSNLSKSAANYQ